MDNGGFRSLSLSHFALFDSVGFRQLLATNNLKMRVLILRNAYVKCPILLLQGERVTRLARSSQNED